jgi:hypothetical protein
MNTFLAVLAVIAVLGIVGLVLCVLAGRSVYNDEGAL